MKNKKICIIVVCLLCILGAVFADSEPVELVSDPLKLVIYPKTGNFCLYRMDASQASFYSPLYDDRTQASLNVYSLLFNGHIYHLNNKSGKKIIIEQTRSAITVTFQISLDFIAVQHFSFEKTNGITTGPILKVVTEVQNISGAVADIALKAVFDTSFGEKHRIPFYTDIRSEIGSELMLQPALEKDMVIFSADTGCSTMFFLKGPHQTTPASVFIANWERLITKTWIPPYVHGRSFKKFSSSDPGILYVWSERKVANKQFFSISNCIGFYDYRAYHVQTAPSAPSVRTSRVHKTTPGTDTKAEAAFVSGNLPDTVSPLENTVPNTAPPQTENTVREETVPQPEHTAAEETMPEAGTPASEAIIPQPENTLITPSVHDSQPTEQTAETEQTVQKNYEDIEKLLEQIKQLEQDPSDVSQYEIYQLQQEVDAIIKTLQEE